ncbi:MAG: hypothetical protein ACHQ2Y_06295 [Candidatus Lutacidiplasmatales archaeon]
MSEELRPEQARTGALWGVLTVLLLFGTVAAAFVVYGLSDLVNGGRLLPDALISVAGALVATLAFLFVTGILYKVDRVRGVIHREVPLFE